MPAATAAPARHRANAAREGLRCRVRLADGRVFTGALAPERHRALQLGVLHEQTGGLVELAAGARRDGRLQITTRRRADHFLPGGQAGGGTGWGDCWRSRARHADARRGGVRRPGRAGGSARGDKHAVSETRFLWVDVDQPDELHGAVGVPGRAPVPSARRERRPGGAHAYWKLDQPLPATRVVESTGELVEPIERAHLRLIHHLGTGADGKPNVADPACAERSRVMRLAGTRERQDRRARADPRGRPRAARLPDPAARRRPARPDAALAAPRARAPATSADPYKRIGPREYFERLAGIVVPRDGLVSCPAAGHEDRNPSCSVGTDASQGWRCHAGGCGARGAIYDLASVLLGGPWGPQLRGEAFKRARAYVIDVFGELPDQPRATSEGVRTMSARNGRVTRLRTRSDVGEELMGAADAIADMAQRVQLNGPEPTYASEKLSYALFKAAEGLALCDVEFAEVREEARRGHEHGLWVREDAR